MRDIVKAITLKQFYLLFKSISIDTPGNVFGMPENVFCFKGTLDNFWYAI